MLAGGGDDHLTSVFLRLTGGSALQELDESRMKGAFTYLLLPHLWSSRNRARRRRSRRFHAGASSSAASRPVCSPHCSMDLPG